MLLLISIVSLLIILYSMWYLADDPHLIRFLSFLFLFIFSMFLLVSSNHFLLLFLGWESVGLISFLLINFWFNSIPNTKSALKAFLFNKVGDLFLLLSLFSLFLFGDLSFSSPSLLLFPDPLLPVPPLNFSFGFLGFLLPLLFAAMAKSAQIFFHPWLSDAMAGPTPVSALLHAATMVTAGLFLLYRLFGSFDSSEPWVSFLSPLASSDSVPPSLFLFFVSFVGVLTLFLGGLSSFFQSDIKKLIALSTCSQIGLMFLSLPSSPTASLFHLFTHGFFKSLLFLSSGFFIHSFSSSFPSFLGLEQDLRKLGSLLFSSPLLFLFFFIGSLSLIAFPSFSGFFSKDSLLFSTSPSLFFCILFGSLLSSFYSFKLLTSSFSLSSSPSSGPLPWGRGFPHSPFLPLLSSPFSFPLPLFFGSLLLGSFFYPIFFPSCDLSSFSFEFFPLPLDSLSWSPEPLTSGFSSEVLASSGTPYGPTKGLSFEETNPEGWKPPGFKSFPFLLPLFSLLLFLLFPFRSTPFLSHTLWPLRPLFNLRFSFDSLFNYLFFFPSLSFSFHFSFKFIDRGLLELFGPLGFFRLFSFPSLYITEGLSFEETNPEGWKPPGFSSEELPTRVVPTPLTSSWISPYFIFYWFFFLLFFLLLFFLRFL